MFIFHCRGSTFSGFNFSVKNPLVKMFDTRCPEQETANLTFVTSQQLHVPVIDRTRGFRSVMIQQSLGNVDIISEHAFKKQSNLTAKSNLLTGETWSSIEVVSYKTIYKH